METQPPSFCVCVCVCERYRHRDLMVGEFFKRKISNILPRLPFCHAVTQVSDDDRRNIRQHHATKILKTKNLFLNKNGGNFLVFFGSYVTECGEPLFYSFEKLTAIAMAATANGSSIRYTRHRFTASRFLFFPPQKKHFFFIITILSDYIYIFFNLNLSGPCNSLYHSFQKGIASKFLAYVFSIK